MFRALLQGQLISLLIAGTGVFASILSDAKANFPMLLSFLNYLLLSMFIWRKRIIRKVCGHTDGNMIINKNEIGIENGNQSEIGTPEIFTEEKEEDSTNAENVRQNVLQNVPMNCAPQISRKLLFCYFGAALVDVEANFLIIQAYNYTSITSIMLLDCFTIPCVMSLSYFLLGCRYNYHHLLGVLLCILGLICIVISDLISEQEQYGSNPFFGDVLCLFGSALYAVSNVSQEYLVKYHDRDEYLGFVGVCGAFISSIQLLSLNCYQLKRTKFTSKIILSITGFVSCLFFMYINTSAFLQQGDSTLFNLSLLTSDVYAVIFSYFFYGVLVHWLYFLAFLLVASGLLIYHSAKAPLQSNIDIINNNRTDRNDNNFNPNFNNFDRNRNGNIIYNPVDSGYTTRSYDIDNDVLLTVLPSSLSSVSLTKIIMTNSVKITKSVKTEVLKIPNSNFIFDSLAD